LAAGGCCGCCCWLLAAAAAEMLLLVGNWRLDWEQKQGARERKRREKLMGLGRDGDISIEPH